MYKVSFLIVMRFDLDMRRVGNARREGISDNVSCTCCLIQACVVVLSVTIIQALLKYIGVETILFSTGLV